MNHIPNGASGRAASMPGQVAGGTPGANSENMTPQQRLLARQQYLAQQQQKHQQQQQQFEAAMKHIYSQPLQYSRKKFQFAETTSAILTKYNTFKASLEFHIYDSYYKFSNQDGMISKSNPVIREFLECIARETLPESMMEVIRDTGIQLYEGCVMLQIYDHRDSESGKPRSFRTLLRPTNLSMYYDSMMMTDQLRVSDTTLITMESEILSLVNRNLDLSVPLNPYKVPHLELGSEVTHRSVCTDPASKECNPHQEIHVDSPHQSSNYEELMLLFSDSMGQSEPNFNRLRFVEQFRLDRDKKRNENIANRISMAVPQTRTPTQPVSQLPSRTVSQDDKKVVKKKKVATPVGQRKVAGKTLPGQFNGKKKKKD